MLGKAVHIRRMQNPASGRIFTVALDHGPSYGVLAGLENIQATIDRVAAARPDAMLMTKGVAERCFEPHAGQVALIMKASTLSPYHPQHDVWVHHVEDALRLGADAIAMAMTVGSPDQAKLIANAAALAREAERVGLPLIVHAYPNGDLVPRDEVYTAARVGYAARLAMELGVDIIKTFYTGSPETFARVVEMASPALVVAAGGPRLNKDEDVLRMAGEVVEAGAAGITFGRNVWQSPHLESLIQSLKDVVHQGSAVGEALALAAAG